MSEQPLTRRPQHRKSRLGVGLKRLITIATGGALLVGASLAAQIPSPSAAATHIAGIATWETYMGFIQLDDGTPGICLGNGNAEPTSMSGSRGIYSPMTAALLHAAWKKVQAGDANRDNIAAAAAWQAKEAATDLPHNHANPTPSSVVDMTLYNTMKAEAEAIANATPSKPVPTPISGTNGVKYGHIGLQRSSTDATLLSGHQLVLTLSGTANPTWSDGSTTMTVTSTSSFIEATAYGNNTGTIHLTVTVTDLPSQEVMVLDGVPAGYQNFVSANIPTAPRDNFADPFDFVLDFDVTISSTVADKFPASVGDFLDTITVSAAAGDDWPNVPGATPATPVSLVGTLEFWRNDVPLAESTTPSGTLVASAPVTFDGPGAKPVAGSDLPAGLWDTIMADPGTYSIVTKILKADQSHDQLRSDAIHGFNIASETFQAKWQGHATSQASVSTGQLGGSVFDSLTLSGFPAGHGSYTASIAGIPADVSKVDVKLYGPFAARPTGSTSLTGVPVAGSWQINAVNGTVSVPTWTAPTSTTNAGGDWYVYVASFPGDGRVAAFTSSPGEQSEQVFVPNTTKITISSLTGSDYAFAGQSGTDTIFDTTEAATISDTIQVALQPGQYWPKVSGTPVTIPVTNVIYGPYGTPQAAKAVGVHPGSGEPVATTITQLFTGPGTQTLTWTPPAGAPGFYTVVSHVLRTDAPNPAAGATGSFLAEDARTVFWDQDETVSQFWRPEIVSQAREYNVAPGGSAADTITITGFPTDHGTMSATAGYPGDVTEMTVTLYGPFAAPPAADIDLSAAPSLSSVQVPAVNGTVRVGQGREFTLPSTVTYPTGDHYVFVVEFAGDGRVPALHTSPADYWEAIYVPGTGQPATFLDGITQAQASSPLCGTITDTALIYGTGVLAGDYLVFTTYWAPEGTDAAGATLFATSAPVPVTKTGAYTSPPVTAPCDVPGTIYWVESYHRAGGDLVFEGEIGIPSETTQILGPDVDVEKWSTNEGWEQGGLGDHDGEDTKNLEVGVDEAITMTFTNTGPEDLVDIVATDATDAGPDVVGFDCDFSALGGPSTGLTWKGPWHPGDQFTCTAILKGMAADIYHHDTVAVEAKGAVSGKPVDDEDDWSGKTGKPPTPNRTPSLATKVVNQVVTVGQAAQDTVSWSAIPVGSTITIQTVTVPVVDLTKPVTEWVCDLSKIPESPAIAGTIITTTDTGTQKSDLVPTTKSGTCVLFRAQIVGPDGAPIVQDDWGVPGEDVKVTAEAKATGDGKRLPVTGADIAWPTMTGIALLVIGVAMAMSSRTRRHAATFGLR